MGVSRSPMNSAYSGTTSYSRASVRASARLGVRFLPVTLIQHPRHFFGPHAALLEQDEQMVQEVRGFLGEPVVFEGGDDDLDGFLPDLLGGVTRSAPEELRGVRALRHLLVAGGDHTGQMPQSTPEVRDVPARLTVDGRKEAAALPRVARRPGGLDAVEQGVAVAVETYLKHPLRVPAGRALAPQLPARAGIIVGVAGLPGLLHGLAVGVGEHEDLPCIGVLRHDGDEARVVEAYVLGRRHRTGTPAFAMRSLTAAIDHSSKWKMLAARTAEAPARTAATMWSGCPAPPEAMIGTPVLEATSEMRSRS